MNEIVNKFLLTWDKFMPTWHLRQPGFTYSACRPFTKHRQRIQRVKKTSDLNYIYKNKLDKASFAHDVAYADSKDIAKRTVSDKVLKDRAYEIALNPIYNGYQRGLENVVYKFFGKKIASGAIAISKTGAKVNEVLAHELHKPMIKIGIVNESKHKPKNYGLIKEENFTATLDKNG